MNYWIAPGVGLKTPSDILHILCRVTEISIEDIKGKSRKTDIISARMVYCYICCYITNASTYDIGKEIGKDHATVIHARDTVLDKITTNDKIIMNILKKLDWIWAQ